MQEVKRDPIKLTLHGFDKGTPLDMVAWADAAWANCPDNTSSTGGIVIGAAPRQLRDGKLCHQFVVMAILQNRSCQQ